jgi:hypothetical protein
MKRITEDFRAAFPDLRFVVELLVGEGDYVVGRCSATGTHTGRWGGVEATGKAANRLRGPPAASLLVALSDENACKLALVVAARGRNMPQARIAGYP